MLKEKRNEIVELFKKNIGKYISQEDLQEIITSITYLFWNAKFVMKNDFEKELNNNDIDCLFQKGNENNQSFIIFLLLVMQLLSHVERSHVVDVFIFYLVSFIWAEI